MLSVDSIGKNAIKLLVLKQEMVFQFSCFMDLEQKESADLPFACKISFPGLAERAEKARGEPPKGDDHKAAGILCRLGNTQMAEVNK